MVVVVVKSTLIRAAEAAPGAARASATSARRKFVTGVSLLFDSRRESARARAKTDQSVPVQSQCSQRKIAAPRRERKVLRHRAGPVAGPAAQRGGRAVDFTLALSAARAPLRMFRSARFPSWQAYSNIP